MGGWVAGLIENITNSAQLRLGLGLSLAIMLIFVIDFDDCFFHMVSDSTQNKFLN